jgi:predicted NUDIX family NTP pyrophosphohydrolase
MANKIKKQSAGILLYRSIDPETEVLLVHPGDHFGKTKMMEPGLFRKVSLTNQKSH